jgi:hypothetical protein
MKAALTRALACLVILGFSHSTLGQEASQSPLSAEAFQKLKQRALEDKKTIVMPPGARIALQLPETNSRVECKQLVAGDLTKKYFFIVLTDKNTDDVFFSQQDGNGNVRMYLTNSKLVLRNVATATPDTKLRHVLNVPAEAGAFNDVLAIWAQVAAGL